MGTDIEGWVEVRVGETPEDQLWVALIDIWPLLRRDYDSFGCLFGVRNSARFRPVAPDRGLPLDLSETAKEAVLGRSFGDLSEHSAEAISAALDARETHSASWLSLAEIQAIDLDEPAPAVDERVSTYRREADGTLTLVGKTTWGGSSGHIRSAGPERQGQPSWEEGHTWEEGSLVFRAERPTRREVLGGWQLLFRLMEVVGEQYGGECVRLVVWFVG